LNVICLKIRRDIQADEQRRLTRQKGDITSLISPKDWQNLGSGYMSAQYASVVTNVLC
jgi:hypothetical protein